MPLSIPPELKKATPYVRRAEELDKDKANPESRLVAYYCRQYAVHTGIPLAVTAPGKTCLGELLSSLEQEKMAMDMFSREEAKFLCRKFADKIFDKADLEDRTGDANKNTAKTFYAAASFLEILQQFFQDEDESEEVSDLKKRAVYAKWKAMDILKALKEGRQPTPGGYGEEEEEEEAADDDEADAVPKVETVSEDEDASSEPEPSALPPPVESTKSEEGTEVELGPPPPAYPSDDDDDDAIVLPPPAASAPPAAIRPPISFNPPPVVPPPMMPVPPTTKPQPPSPEPEKKHAGFFGLGKKKKGKLTKAEFADAMELTKFAMAALEDKNADLAAERMKNALQVLGR
jgi:vacuolar protein sorting-associated protein VTA1